MRFINTTDLMGPEWRFLDGVRPGSAATWQTVSGRPQGLLERHLHRPHLGRWRAATQAALAAAGDPACLLVSHLPLMAAATNVMRRTICPDVPQIAFSFNFTDLPVGFRRSFLRHTLRSIAQFVVFSRLELVLYQQILGLPERKLRFLPWAMEPPRPGQDTPLSQVLRRDGYLCAIGGEGRDYALLAEAMRTLPDLRMVIVGRPHTLAGINFPANVTTFANLPGPTTWKIAADSLGMAIPLRSETTACGHITLVGAQLLGLPLAITASQGVADYVAADRTAQTISAGDVSGFATALRRMVDDRAAVLDMATAARTEAERRSALTAWHDYLQETGADLLAAQRSQRRR